MNVKIDFEARDGNNKCTLDLQFREEIHMNLSSTITRGSQYFGSKKALIFGDKSFSYAELNNCIDQAALHLKKQGLTKGDRVALYLGNCPEWIVFYFAIIRLGAVAVCLSASYRSTELKSLINDSQPVLIITSEALHSYLNELEIHNKLPDVLVYEKDEILLSIFEKKAARIEIQKTEDCQADDVCVILFTGGTTGTPKGAMLTHGNLLYTSQNVCFHEQMIPEDVCLCFMPLNHVFAGIHIMNSAFYGGATLILHDGFDMDKILSSIETKKVNRFYAVPTVYIRLLNAPDTKNHLQSLNYCFSAATSMPSEIVRQWKKVFALDIHEAYGMTETSSLVTFNHICRHKMGSVGTPAGIVEVKLVDENGHEVNPGENGEIAIHGPNVMKGYFDKPMETAKVMPKGWLHSGDVGRFDEEGYLYIVDRTKDIIISGGFSVFPTEVEEFLYGHPAVEECAVVGIPHQEYGETVTAFIRVKEGQTSRDEEIIQFSEEKIASYKVPKKVVFVKDFPKTLQGKILKRELRKYKF